MRCIRRIGCALKHFSGYGNNTDTHKGLAIDNRSYDAFLVLIYAFPSGIEVGAGAFCSHTIVNCLDKDLPASLSLRYIAYCGRTAV